MLGLTCCTGIVDLILFEFMGVQSGEGIFKQFNPMFQGTIGSRLSTQKYQCLLGVCPIRMNRLNGL